jgi:hypothetical protein
VFSILTFIPGNRKINIETLDANQMLRFIYTYTTTFPFEVYLIFDKPVWQCQLLQGRRDTHQLAVRSMGLSSKLS